MNGRWAADFLFFGVGVLLAGVQGTGEGGRIIWVHRSSLKGDIPAPDLGRQVAALILDVDRDGCNDFVIASYEKMVWFRRGAGGWTRFLIENGQPGVRMEAGGDFHDLDGGGDLDVVMGAQSKAGEIWWWENPHPRHDPGTPWKRHLAVSVGGTHHDQVFGDFDGDGRAELVFWHNVGRRLYLARIPADPAGSWPCFEIARLPEGRQNPEELARVDVDGDGKVDIVGGGYWFRHVEGSIFRSEAVDPEYRFSRSSVGDLIQGGRPEIVISSGTGWGL